MTHLRHDLPLTQTRSRLAAWSMALALSLGVGCGGPIDETVANEELNMGDEGVEASGAAATTPTRDYDVSMPIYGPFNRMGAHCTHLPSRLMVKESPTAPWRTYTSTQLPSAGWGWQQQWNLRGLTGIYKLRLDVWGGSNCAAGTTVASIRRYDNGITAGATGYRFIPVARASGETLRTPVACARDITANVYATAQLRAADIVGSARVVVGRAAGATTVDGVPSALQGSCYYDNGTAFRFAVTSPTTSTFVSIEDINF